MISELRMGTDRRLIIERVVNESDHQDQTQMRKVGKEDQNICMDSKADIYF